MKVVWSTSAWCCTLLSVICVALGLLAAPLGEARADPPIIGGSGVNCGGWAAYNCTGQSDLACIQTNECRDRNGPCTCKWGIDNQTNTEKCGCFYAGNE